MSGRKFKTILKKLPVFPLGLPGEFLDFPWYSSSVSEGTARPGPALGVAFGGCVPHLRLVDSMSR
jgi:hypothetical protein